MSVVQKKEFSRNGAPKFQIDGSWYFIEREVQTQGLEPGASINFKWREFGEDRGRGRPKTITSWAPATSQNDRRDSYAEQANYRQGGQNTGNLQSQEYSKPLSTITEVDILRSVSNVVGSACSAGVVKTPEELEKWCVAARFGLTRAMSAHAQTQEREPGSDDDSGEPDFNDPLEF
jgi:hypothetical protein